MSFLVVLYISKRILGITLGLEFLGLPDLFKEKGGFCFQHRFAVGMIKQPKLSLKDLFVSMAPWPNIVIQPSALFCLNPATWKQSGLDAGAWSRLCTSVLRVCVTLYIKSCDFSVTQYHIHKMKEIIFLPLCKKSDKVFEVQSWFSQQYVNNVHRHTQILQNLLAGREKGNSLCCMWWFAAMTLSPRRICVGCCKEWGIFFCPHCSIRNSTNSTRRRRNAA